MYAPLHTANRKFQQLIVSHITAIICRGRSVIPNETQGTKSRKSARSRRWMRLKGYSQIKLTTTRAHITCATCLPGEKEWNEIAILSTRNKRHGQSCRKEWAEKKIRATEVKIGTCTVEWFYSEKTTVRTRTWTKTRSGGVWVERAGR